MRTPLDEEQSRGLQVLVATRWVLLGCALFVTNYRPGTDVPERIALNFLIAAAAVLNAVLLLLIVRRRPIPLAVPVLVGGYDLAALLTAVALVDGVENSAFVLMLPALMAFSLSFPGRWSIVCGTLAIVAYVCIVSLLQRDRLESSLVTNEKAIVMRAASMAALVMGGNIVMSLERSRRRAAVAAERTRRDEVLRLETEAREQAQRAEAERQRLTREVHDGISQELFMLTLSLETAAMELKEGRPPEQTLERIEALARLSKQALLDTRSLLLDLKGVLEGDQSLAVLVTNLAREFETITGVNATVSVSGHQRALSPGTVGEIYRVLQESLANVFRHAAASSVEIRISFEEGTVDVEIADDGHGFDPNSAGVRGHGLGTMSDRARELGGSLSVDSGEGVGTRVALHVPAGGTQ